MLAVGGGGGAWGGGAAWGGGGAGRPPSSGSGPAGSGGRKPLRCSSSTGRSGSELLVDPGHHRAQLPALALDLVALLLLAHALEVLLAGLVLGDPLAGEVA